MNATTLESEVGDPSVHGTGTDNKCYLLAMQDSSGPANGQQHEGSHLRQQDPAQTNQPEPKQVSYCHSLCELRKVEAVLTDRLMGHTSSPHHNAKG